MALRQLEEAIRQLQLRAGTHGDQLAEIDGELGLVAEILAGQSGTTAQRDAHFGTPATDAERVALANRQPVYFNTESGWQESYYAPAGLAGLTARGLVAGVPAGWYPIGRGPYQRLRPTAGFTTANATPVRNWMGQRFRAGGSAWFDYNNANGRVQIVRGGRYEINVWTTQQAGSGTANYHLRQMSVGTTEQHVDGLAYTLVSNLYTHAEAKAQMQIGPNRELDFFCHAGTIAVHQGGGTTIPGEFTVEYVGPALAAD